MKIVKLLNQLYTEFDVLTDPKKNPNIYKVNKYPKRNFVRFTKSFKWLKYTM